MNYSNDDIERIIVDCKKGNRLAQEKLYRSFFGVMMNICMRYTKNEEDAREALNTGFYKVFKNIQAYNKSKGAPFTWIRTIIINNCLNFIRSKSRMEEALEEESSTDVYIPPEALLKMQSDEILRLVRNLPPATQAVFNLYVIDGYNHKEIGGMLEISEGTSKWHLSEARKILQKQLKQLQ